MICILKTVFGYLILIFAGTNILGFVVRGLIPSYKRDDVGNLILIEDITSRRSIIITITFTLIGILYFYLLYHYWNAGVAIAAALTMFTRIPYLLYEIRTGRKVTLKYVPKNFFDFFYNIIDWIALPTLLWYSLCKPIENIDQLNMTIPYIIIGLVVVGFFLKILRAKNVSDKSSSAVNKYILVNNLLKRANEKSLVEDFRSAVAITDKVLLLQPNNYNALTCRACGLEALNFNLEAIDDYEKALQIDNSDANIYGLLGLTYTKIGEIEKGLKNLKISIQKGLKRYEMNYDIYLSAPEEMKEAMIKRAKVQENLQRRNPNDFIDDLSSVDEIEFKEIVKIQIQHLKRELSLDPDNTELKELYEFAKRQIE